MLDANDIQIISKIVSDALAEERKHTEAILAKQKKEIHADMMTIIESEVNPKLRILAEGHEALLERMTPPEEIENMKADIVILKESVKSLSLKVNAPQKAQ